MPDSHRCACDSDKDRAGLALWLPATPNTDMPGSGLLPATLTLTSRVWTLLHTGNPKLGLLPATLTLTSRVWTLLGNPKSGASTADSIPGLQSSMTSTFAATAEDMHARQALAGAGRRRQALTAVGRRWQTLAGFGHGVRSHAWRAEAHACGSC
eukprot:291713-Chlamydomonas_euryale.AAC.7